MSEEIATSPTTSLLMEPQNSDLSHLDHKDKFSASLNSVIHKCHLCNYKTPYRSSLRSHYAVHSTDRPFACDMCMYEAKRLNDLRKHKLVKHGKRMPLMARNRRRKCAMLPPLSPASSFTPNMPDHTMHLGLQDVQTGTPVTHQDVTDIPLAELTELIPNTSVFPEPELRSATASRPSDSDAVVIKSELPDNYLYFTSGDDQTKGHCDRFGAGRINNMNSHGTDYDCFNLDILPKRHGEHPLRTPSAAGMSALLSQNSSRVPSLTGHHANSPANYRPTTSQYATNLNHTGRESRESTDGRSLTDDSSHHSSPNNQPVSVRMRSRMRSVGTETRKGWHCKHCDILFFDSAIYFMHMGLHSPNNVWQCNLCSEALTEVYSFTSHFINAHSDTGSSCTGDRNGSLSSQSFCC